MQKYLLILCKHYCVAKIFYPEEGHFGHNNWKQSFSFCFWHELNATFYGSLRSLKCVTVNNGHLPEGESQVSNGSRRFVLSHSEVEEGRM